MRTKPFATLALVLLGAGRTAAMAADDHTPLQGVLNLSANAVVEVTKDMLSVQLSATRDGPDAATVQVGLKQALDAALNEARKAAKPGQLDVRTSDFSVFPRYNDKGRITGWQGTAGLVIEGRDIPAIAQLTGRLPTVSIAHVAYGLSREARERVEGDVTAQAITRYKQRAAEMSRQFGYTSYTIREVNVASSEPPPIGGFTLMRAKAAMADQEALPTEPGKETITATVSGSVQMKP